MYATLTEYAAGPPTETNAIPNNIKHQSTTHNTTQPSHIQQNLPIPITFKCKAHHRFLARQLNRQQQADEDAYLETQITWAEDIHTAEAKKTSTNQTRAINQGHKLSNHKPTSILHNSRTAGYAFATAIKRATQSLQQANHVQFNSRPHVCLFSIDDIPAVTYDTGADGHYLNEYD